MVIRSLLTPALLMLASTSNAFAAIDCAGYNNLITEKVMSMRGMPTGGANDPDENSTAALREEIQKTVARAKADGCNPPAIFAQKYPTPGIGERSLADTLPFSRGDEVVPPKDYITDNFPFVGKIIDNIKNIFPKLIFPF